MFKITYYDTSRLKELDNIGEDIVIACHYAKDIFVLTKLPLRGKSYYWTGIGNVRSRLGNDAIYDGEFFNGAKEAIEYVLFFSYGCSYGRVDVHIFENLVEFSSWMSDVIAYDWLKDEYMKS